MFICSYPPKWLINVLSLPSLWFYEQNLSRYRLQNSLTVYSSTDILSWHGKYAEPSANIFSIQHTFILRRGRRVLCNFVRRKTNIRAQCKLPVNWWKVHGGRQLSNFATKLNFDFPLVASSRVMIKRGCVRYVAPSVHINARWGGSVPQVDHARRMKVIYDIWWLRWLINVHIIKPTIRG